MTGLEVPPATESRLSTTAVPRRRAAKPRSSDSAAFNRIANYVATRGFLHLVLLTGVGIFLFPFVWMVAISLKTDDEVTNGQFLPAMPQFRAQSPFVRSAEEPERPDALSEMQWKAIRSLLLRRAAQAVRDVPLPAGAQNLNADSLQQSAATLLLANTGKLPRTIWNKAANEITDAFAAQLSPQNVSDALENSLGRLELRGLQVRSIDAHIFNICSGPEVARDWKVESGPGELLPLNSGASYLHYHFSSPSDPPIVLRYQFPFPIQPGELHKLMLAMKGDDSWHRLDATLDVGTTHWETDESSSIAQYRAGSLLFQPRGFDDTTYQPKSWITLRAVSSSPLAENTAANSATLRVVLRPSSTLQAVYGKVKRNYGRAFHAVPFWTYVRNSVLLVALQLVGSLFSAAFVAYAFARLNWPGRSVAFAILLSTMMLPGQVTMIPSFLIWKTLGWYNTLNPLWIGSWFGSAFFIFLMTQNMKTIPRELEEAARIDGLNPVQTWWYIILPLVKPTLAAIAIMVFMGAWNEFMGPLIMLRDQEKFPLSLGLFGMRVDQAGDWTLIMAGNMLMTLPVIAIFFLFQRYFIEGVTVSGMKG